MSASGYTYIDVDEIKVITAAAMLCVIEGTEVWLPLSQIADAGDYDVGDADVEIAITEFIARQKGLV